MYYALSGVAHQAVVGLLVNKTLDPHSPDYQWQDGGPVAWSLGDGKEDLHAIDPGAFYDTGNGTLWLVYGSYFGTIRLAQLDPRTGKRLHQEQSQTIIANQSEAPNLIAHDGWYYLLTNHGTCCAGASSTYNIRAGRSKTITGPYLDDHGIDMARGGGRLFAASGDRKVGPGHFGLLDLEMASRNSPATMRPTSIAAPRSASSTSSRCSARWLAGRRRECQRGHLSGDGEVLWHRAGTGGPGHPRHRRGGVAVGGPAADAEEGAGHAEDRHFRPRRCTGNRPRGTAPGHRRSAAFAQLAPGPGRRAHGGLSAPGAAEVDAHPGGQCRRHAGRSLVFKITVAGTDRTLAATADDELIALPAFTGDATQLWRIDQLADGSYRIMPKSSKNQLALTSIGAAASRSRRLNSTMSISGGC